MTLKKKNFEVEFRYHFDNSEDAYEALPFMRSCLHRQFIWHGTFYGLELFKSGQLLRTADVVEGENTQYYLTWKGPDTGKFANIRQEIVENITNGVTNSSIFILLGGKEHIQHKNEAIQELERLGHHKFMSWEGINLNGYYQPYNVNVKLMSCSILKWPLIVEIEKMATTEEESIQCENELYELSRKFKLQGHLLKEEPPALLYTKILYKKGDD